MFLTFTQWNPTIPFTIVARNGGSTDSLISAIAVKPYRASVSEISIHLQAMFWLCGFSAWCCGGQYRSPMLLRSRYENPTPNFCWVFCALLGSCAINNRAFLRLHLCRHTFASLWGACLRFALLWHTIRVSSAFIFHMFAEVKLRCEALRRHFIMTCDIFSTGQTNILGLCYLFGKTFKQPTKAPVKSLKSTHSTKLLHLLRWTIQ